jgi:hypothetical protein
MPSDAVTANAPRPANPLPSEPRTGTGGVAMRQPPLGYRPARAIGATPDDAAIEAAQARYGALARHSDPIAIEAAGRAYAGAVQRALFAAAMRRIAAGTAAMWQRVRSRGERSARAAGGGT